MSRAPRALFIGRYQPFHAGHQWLIAQKLARGVPVLVAVRDIEPDEDNPYDSEYVAKTIRLHYALIDEDVEVIVIPDIESVNYGRGVGYEINEYVPPKEIGEVSATKIREELRAKGEL